MEVEAFVNSPVHVALTEVGLGPSATVPRGFYSLATFRPRDTSPEQVTGKGRGKTRKVPRLRPLAPRVVERERELQLGTRHCLDTLRQYPKCESFDHVLDLLVLVGLGCHSNQM